MSETFISTTGLLLCLAPALVHGVELIRPLWARWVVNWILPFFAPGAPQRSKFLNAPEQLTMLDAALDAAPHAKSPAGADYIFLMLFEQRQGALAFLALASGIVYGLMQPLADRGILHFILGVMTVFFMLVNANHAGLRFLGNHPRISRNGRHVGFVFTAFWAFAAIQNWMAFSFTLG